MQEQRRIVFVALGDSLTAGFQSPGPTAPVGRGTPYTQWLEKRAREKLRCIGRGMDLTVVNSGVNGDSTDGMSRRFARDVAAKRPNYVIVWAGINDIYAGRRPSEVFKCLVKLYEKCRAIDACAVGCTLTPVEAPDQVNEEIVKLNRLVRNHCLRERIPCVDLHNATTDISGRLKRELSNDGVHFNAEGYRLVAEIIYRDAVEDILKSLH
jgi:lysophospholipase L1-like esterase